MLPSERVNSHLIPEDGSLTCKEMGSCEFLFVCPWGGGRGGRSIENGVRDACVSRMGWGMCVCVKKGVGDVSVENGVGNVCVDSKMGGGCVSVESVVGDVCLVRIVTV